MEKEETTTPADGTNVADGFNVTNESTQPPNPKRSKRSHPSEEVGNNEHGGSCFSVQNYGDDFKQTKQQAKEGGDKHGIKSQEGGIVRQMEVEPTKDPKPTSPRNEHRMTLEKLRLEAVFHPKFENETADKDVRKKMLSKIEEGKGYLEVTLKHSGSLLLWSGGNRFYSKNSTNNLVTLVGEFLLRRHMALLWDSESSDTGAHVISSKYEECGDYVQRHRLTLAFEIVTSVLGDHGGIPKQPYLILLAVADRNRQQFYTSHQLITLAQTFRLPHNDYWVFSTINSAAKLFEFYDDVREIGTAERMTKGLDQLVNLDMRPRIECMYPHNEYQGNILEGLVVRFVPTNSTDMSRNNGIFAATTAGFEDDFLHSLNDLATVAKCNVSVALSNKSKATMSPNTILSKQLQDFFPLGPIGTEEQAEGSLRQFLNLQCTSDDGCQRLQPKSGIEKEGDWDIHQWMRDLVNRDADSTINSNSEDKEAGLDQETQQILRLIETLKQLNVAVSYKLFREDSTTNGADQSKNVSTTNGASVELMHRPSKSRWICLIHVFHDGSFKKYNHQMSPGDIPLFRGFSFRLIFKGEIENTKELDNGALTLDDPMQCHGSSQPLMLKLKLLPYTNRTYGCRNGLRVISKLGVDGYERYTLEMLKKWGVSHGSLKKWQPYFYSWGVYAKTILDQQEREMNFLVGPKEVEMSVDNQLSRAVTEVTRSMAPHPLSEQNYLTHLEHFEKLYQRGQVVSPRDSNQSEEEVKYGFRGVVVVFSVVKDMSVLFSNALSKKLSVKRQLNDISKMTDIDMLSALAENRGIIYNAAIQDNKKALTSLLKQKQYCDAISVVKFGCSQEDIDSRFKDKGNEYKKISGMAKSLTKLNFKNAFELPIVQFRLDLTGSSNGTKEVTPEEICESEEAGRIASKLLDLSRSLPVQENGPGMLVFFPGIPGSGKSCLCCDEIELAISESREKAFEADTDINATKQPTRRKRNVLICEGDSVKEKYWPLVTKKRLEEPSSILIADKNAAPASWDVINEVCNKSETVPIPVLPDSKALSTVTVEHKTPSNSSGQTNTQTCYPFSLAYLAECMLRVLTRPSGSHNGKLDESTENACMVVVKFYSFFRHLSAESFFSAIQDKIMSSTFEGDSSLVIRIPFFDESVPIELPMDLESCLIDALQMQYSIDKGESNESESVLMEKKLRELLLLHKDVLQSMCASEEKSRESFTEQVANNSIMLDSMSQSAERSIESTESRFIEIASVDVIKEDVEKLLSTLSAESKDVDLFMKRARSTFNESQANCDEPQVNQNKGTTCHNCVGTFVQKPHVTMAHFSQLSQRALRDEFMHLVGESVKVLVTDMLIGESIAALSVILPSKCNSDYPVELPPSKNEYPHITVWHGNGESAVKSNDLPAMVERGEATKVKLKEPVNLSGTLTHWFL